MSAKDKRESRCVICGEAKNGLEIKSDFIFEAIKKIVHSWRNLIRDSEKNKRNYKLVVCKECYPKYSKARSRYVRREITFIALGLILTAMLFLFSRSALALLYGMIITLFFYLFSQVNYMPALKIPQINEKNAGNLRIKEK